MNRKQRTTGLLVAGAIVVSGLSACGGSSGTNGPVVPKATVTQPPANVMTASQLEISIKNSGDWTSSDETVSYKINSIQCEPTSVNAVGVGKYQCDLWETIDKSSDVYYPVGTKASQSREIIVGADGSWVDSNN